MKGMSSKDLVLRIAIFVAAVVAVALTRDGTVLNSAGIGLISASVVTLVMPGRVKERRLPDESGLSRLIRYRRARRQ
jgi:hypothetical protein